MDTNNVALKEFSPYFSPHFKPLLLIHGKHDKIVPYSQSVVMTSELKTAGIPGSFITLLHSAHTGEGASH